jgi:hypothetical protein
MAAQASQTRISTSFIQRLYNLHSELSGSAPTALTANTTTTITIVHTASGDTSTINSSVT